MQYKQAPIFHIYISYDKFNTTMVHRRCAFQTQTYVIPRPLMVIPVQPRRLVSTLASVGIPSRLNPTPTMWPHISLTPTWMQHRITAVILTDLNGLGATQPNPQSDMDTADSQMPHAVCNSNGPLTRYVKLQVAHAPGMPGTFSPAADFKGNC